MTGEPTKSGIDLDFAELDNPNFKEDSVREEIILPMLRSLGYRASGDNGIVRSYTLEHPYLTIGSTTRPVTLVPDYLLKANGNFAFVLDAKSPSENILSGKNVEQVFSYATHPEIRVRRFALCNGRALSVFDTQSAGPILHCQIEDVESQWDKLVEALSPENFAVSTTPLPPLVVDADAPFDYLSQAIPLEITSFQKQAAKRHFGVHGYFTKQVWSVVQSYVRNFTKPGDLVLDPFGGSGVTYIESLFIGRKAIHVDINPLSKFIIDNLVSTVNLEKLATDYKGVCKAFSELKPKNSSQISQALKKYAYPKDIGLPKNSDVDVIQQLFSERQLAELALLKNLIEKTTGTEKGVLLLMFSGLINKINLTYHSSSGRSAGRGDSSVFRYYRYRIAPQPAELDTLKYFESRYKKVVAAKLEIRSIKPDLLANSKVIQGSATDLSWIPNNSVDYIYTDPPYGSKIPYLDLSVLWNSWLDLSVSDSDFELEAIEGGERNKTKAEYSDLLEASISEMARVLKYDRWMSFVFAHKDPAYWHLIVDAAERAGFEYAGAVKQDNGQSSFKKRQNPFTVLSGQLIINFRKVKNPKTIGRVNLGAPIMDVIIETCESIIAKNQGATLEQINDELVIRGLEMGFLDILANEYADLTPLLMQQFDFDNSLKVFKLKSGNKFKSHIPLEWRVRYFILSYLRRQQIQRHLPTFDEIVLAVMPLLKNGTTPEQQTILNVLRTLAEPTDGDRWRLTGTGQQELFD